MGPDWLPDMDIPDRIIEDVRLWRFRAQVMSKWDPNNCSGRDGNDPREFRVLNPVPVYADGRMVGYGAVTFQYGTVYADVAIDPAIPQRLDVETGIKQYLLPKVTVFAPKMAPPRPKRDLYAPWQVHCTWGSDPEYTETVVIDGLEIRPDCTDPDLSAIGESFLYDTNGL